MFEAVAAGIVTAQDGRTPLLDSEAQDARATGPRRQRGYLDIAKNMWALGWTAFGGPAAHLGLFQKVFVEKVEWLSTALFLELLALASCLPGPTSTQVSFVLGAIKKGVPGGLLSGILFQYPGLLMLSLLGMGAAKLSTLANRPAWLTSTSDGLAAAAVGMVGAATVGLINKTCRDRLTGVICTLAAVFAFYHTTAWLLPTLILAGGVVTLLLGTRRNAQHDEVEDEDHHLKGFGVSLGGGVALISMYVALLAAAITLRQLVPYESAPWIHWFEAFYRMGGLIFGGGQVVLPMIMSEVVEPGWATQEEFNVALATVQGMPGPLFNISAFLGALIAMKAGWPALVGVAVCWLGLFSPGILLVFGVLPFWHSFRTLAVYHRMLPGLNSAAVGLVVAALVSMTLQLHARAVMPKAAMCFTLLSYSGVHIVKVPAPLVVVLGGGLGAAAWFISNA